MTSFHQRLRIRLHDTDAAGILFFASQFHFMHDAYEDFLREIGLPMEALLAQGLFFVPIVHAEAQFHKSVSVGRELVISVSVERLGNTSYTLVYRLEDSDGGCVGTGRTVHVTVDRKSGRKRALPEDLRQALTPYLIGG